MCYVSPLAEGRSGGITRRVLAISGILAKYRPRSVLIENGLVFETGGMAQGLDKVRTSKQSSRFVINSCSDVTLRQAKTDMT